jgi:ElaB protein
MQTASDTAKGASDYANGQVRSFIDNVEDLTKALKDVDSPDIAKVRAKVKMALAAAKSAMADTASQLRDQAQQVGKQTDTYVRDNPWQVIGIAALVGLAVGIFASRRYD